ncbi:MAG: hypothetical protein EZS28_028643 [Streblomastix strix]|uniref:Uncharacterized protein n=1 Tax=Streblomastix strix TaxID=222440 RepID=A0A5J4V1B9_9EUKA|nr:MAG: hypothetical protein EZS28_028643 [Streblomastix strix]
MFNKSIKNKQEAYTFPIQKSPSIRNVRENQDLGISALDTITLEIEAEFYCANSEEVIVLTVPVSENDVRLVLDDEDFDDGFE